MEIKIVKATAKHREFLIEANRLIHNISGQTNNSEFAARLDEDYYFAEPKFFCSDAEYNSIPVGMLLYSKMYWADDEEVLWVSQLFAYIDYRHKNISSQLIRFMINQNKNSKVIAMATGKNNDNMNNILKAKKYNLIDMNFYAKKLFLNYGT